MVTCCLVEIMVDYAICFIRLTINNVKMLVSSYYLCISYECGLYTYSANLNN
jgi:hypothetical protein